jgi:hypothetical protein
MTKARNIADLLDANGIVDNSKITLDANEIPNLDASKITSGDISAARLSLATETKPVVSSVSPSVITNDAQDIVITGTDFTAIPRVEIINTATGIWYSASTVTRDSATQLTVNLTLGVDAGTYRIRVENPDGLAGLSGANFLTVSDAPTWSTSAGSLGSVAGGLNGAVATVSAGGDTIVYSETTNVLTNASLANCSLNSSTGAITTSDFDGSSTSARTHTFTIRATDAQGQTSDREFTLTSSYAYSADFLVVAGGGSGGYRGSSTHATGGGGAGGFRYLTSQSLSGGITYTITVGAGGTGGAAQNNGANSSIAGTGLTTITSLGGGMGGGGVSAGNGGSGGGSGSGYSGSGQGTGTVGQGNNGGYGNVFSGRYYDGGGGGGASAVGGFANPNSGGNGGAGTANSITGSSITYAGGGGGAARDSVGGTSYPGNGGAGGGGIGGTEVGSQTGGNGTDGLGAGGGGQHSFGGQAGHGGDGVVILRVPTGNYSSTTTGSPTVTTDGNFKVIKFTASGTYTG